MKKLLTVLLLVISTTMLYAEAPELKNMMPNSWQKVTRLTEQEEAEFLRKVDLREYFSMRITNKEMSCWIRRRYIHKYTEKNVTAWKYTGC